MTAGQSILIRADASPAIGSGHVMRCLALAKAWQNAGGNVSYLIAECIPALEDRLSQEGIAITKITTAPGNISDADLTVAEAQRRNDAWVVVDGYRFEPEYIRKLKSAGLRVLFFDDDGRFDFYPADAVLNQNISASPAMYQKREPFTRLLLGSEYVLLRPEFLTERPVREHPRIGRKVLVTMGGSDPENATGRVLSALSGVKSDIEVRIVAGGGNTRYEELQSLANKMALSVSLEHSPESMVPLMLWADVAIFGAGGTSWELAYLGVPSIVITRSVDQQGIAQSLAERGIAVSLGWYANLSETQISEALENLLDDYERRVVMSARGRLLIDGCGAARVVQFLQSSL